MREPVRDPYGPKYIATNGRLRVLAELGAAGTDPRIRRGTDRMLRHWASHEVFGDPEGETCATGNTTRMMLRFGRGEEPFLRSASSASTS